MPQNLYAFQFLCCRVCRYNELQPSGQFSSHSDIADDFSSSICPMISPEGVMGIEVTVNDDPQAYSLAQVSEAFYYRFKSTFSNM